jgi:hypothetical protein
MSMNIEGPIEGWNARGGGAEVFTLPDIGKERRK